MSGHDRCMQFLDYCNNGIKNDSDSVIAITVLSHINDISYLTIESLSDEAHISIASISRFFKKAGFNSFQTFKTEMALFISDMQNFRSLDINYSYKNLSNFEMIEYLYNEINSNLKYTKENLDIDKLYKVVNTLKNSDQIIFIGDTHELSCFYPLQLNLLWKGIPTIMFNISKIKKEDILKIKKSCTICFFSVYSQWYFNNIEYINKIANDCHKTILFAQEKPSFVDELFIFYQYGKEESHNDGYVSLQFICKLLCEMLYKK